MSATGARVLVPLAQLEHAAGLLDIARVLVKARGGQVILLHVVEVTAESSLSEGARAARVARHELDRLEGGGVQIRTMVRVSREAWQGVLEAVEEEGADLLLLHWSGESEPGVVFNTTIDEILREPPCDVVVARIPEKDLAVSSCRRILLPARGSGPHIQLAFELARSLAEGSGAEITVLHAIPKGAHEERAFESLSTVLWGLKGVTRRATVRAEVTDAILQEASDHELIIMGAVAGSSGPPLVGRIAIEVARRAEKPVLVVKARDAGLRKVPPLVKPTAEVVEKWFAENAFHSREFADLEQLVSLKEEQGLTISLGLPALNEAKTVSNVIGTIKTALMDQVPLLDEIVLIDSGSLDRTRDIAADLGIPVYRHQDILPRYGSYEGKGEALWKSLYVLRGDIVAWIDTDIINIHPRFVYGILGPLLRQPRIHYSKGFYRRPIHYGEKLTAAGGGRVTELAARPLINLFFPELSGLIQPLAGEYAGRRSLLERLPFFTGYGVETGLLIDIAESLGLRAIAQVDLQERIHRNQPLPSLSRMSFAIIQVVIRRLEDRHKIRLLEDVNRTMKLICHERRRFCLETMEIKEHERPPMVTIPEYRRQHGLQPAAGSQSPAPGLPADAE